MPKKPVSVSPWNYFFIGSLVLIIIICFHLVDLKANYGFYDWFFIPAILLNSLAIFKILSQKKANLALVIVCTLFLPLLLIAYPTIMNRYDYYCAEHRPGSFYYNPQKGKALIPCRSQY